jgi:hypothetical protein
MKPMYLAMCAAALAACSDSHPTVSDRTRPVPLDGVSEPGTTPANFDSRSVKEVLEGLVARRFGRVTLPADAFSQYSDAVHPDIACPPGGWNGTSCWLMYTPYRNSDPSWENPGFLFQANDTSWLTPSAIRNPIVAYPGVGSYNSDPDHAFDPASKRLIQIFRVVSDSGNRIMLMSTADAHQWTTPVLAFSARNHDAVSPSLVIENDRTAKIWSVKSGAGCTSGSTSVELRTAQPSVGQSFESVRWSAPTPTDLSIPGYVTWHLDVQEISASRYVALVAAFPVGFTCSQSDLWLATSGDGISWKTLELPIFWRGMAIAKSRSISTWYRGTIHYDPTTDMLDVWPSALAGPVWTIYHTKVPLSEITDLMASASPSDLRSIKASSNSVPPSRISMP